MSSVNKKRSAGGKKGKGQDCASALLSNCIPPPEECLSIDLSGHYPPIEMIDGSIQNYTLCEKLSLSSNNIDKIQNLPKSSLKILSLGRNCIKKLDGIQHVHDTLEQLWISYNNIDKLIGIEEMHRLKVLYMSNNKIADWEEIDRLKGLTELTDVLLIGNPLHIKYRKKNMLKEYEREMIKRLPNLKKLDGHILTEEQESSDSEEQQGGRECHANDTTGNA